MAWSAPILKTTTPQRWYECFKEKETKQTRGPHHLIPLRVILREEEKEGFWGGERDGWSTWKRQI